jgi:hypothetical protein
VGTLDHPYKSKSTDSLLLPKVEGNDQKAESNSKSTNSLLFTKVEGLNKALIKELLINL